MKKLILAACLMFSALAMTACGPGDTGNGGDDAGDTGGDDGGSDTDAG